MRLYIWDKPDQNILVIIAGSPAEAQEIAKKEGIEVEGTHQRAIELTEPTPALVVFNGERKEVNMEPSTAEDPAADGADVVTDSAAEPQGEQPQGETPSEGGEQTGGETPQ